MMALALAGAAAILVPADAGAQESFYDDMDVRPLDVDVRVGAAVPAADLTDYADVGVNFGAGAAWHLTDRVALRVDGDVNALPGRSDVATAGAVPDLRLWHVGGGLQFDLARMRTTSPWSLEANVGAGAATLDTDPFQDGPNGEVDLTQTYPDVNAGLELGYRVSEHVTAAVGGQGLIAFTDDEELSPLFARNPAAMPADNAVVFPVTATLSVDLPH
jgi:hypothetical protein